MEAHTHLFSVSNPQAHHHCVVCGKRWDDVHAEICNKVTEGGDQNAQEAQRKEGKEEGSEASGEVDAGHGLASSPEATSKARARSPRFFCSRCGPFHSSLEVCWIHTTVGRYDGSRMKVKVYHCMKCGLFQTEPGKTVVEAGGEENA